MVTHNVAIMGPISQFVVSLAPNGTIADQGTVGEVLSHDVELLKATARENESIEENSGSGSKMNKSESEIKSSGKLMVEEDVALGHVSGEACELISIGIKLHIADWNFHSQIILVQFGRLWFLGLGSLHVRSFRRHHYVGIDLPYTSFIENLYIYRMQTWYLGYWASQYETHPQADVPVLR